MNSKGFLSSTLEKSVNVLILRMSPSKAFCFIVLQSFFLFEVEMKLSVSFTTNKFYLYKVQDGSF